MPTVLWETLRCCITLHCMVRFGLTMSWPSMFLFGSTILHANNPLKNVSSEFVLLCKKAAPLHFIQATPQLVLSPLIGIFANKVACFSRIVSHPIAKSHVKPWSVREHDTAYVDCSFRLFSSIWDWYKTPAKNLNKFFRGEPWPLRPHSGCASARGDGTASRQCSLWVAQLRSTTWPFAQWNLILAHWRHSSYLSRLSNEAGKSV